ncbi:MAG TPA: hypothetical protein VNG29_04365 [Candidatus Paceibacterota bacterium]|nr:hypothetical protein [Candidatus Paceibacterota bacterium]
MKVGRKNFWILLAAIVAVTLLAVFFAARPPVGTGSKPNTVVVPLHFTKIDPNALPPGAPLGAVTSAGLPSSFPKGLVMGTDAVMTVLNGLPSTSTAPHAAPANEYTLTWSAASSASSLFASYKDYFDKNGWTVAYEDSASSSAYVQATMASSTALVVMIPDGSGAQVTVDYVSR